MGRGGSAIGYTLSGVRVQGPKGGVAAGAAGCVEGLHRFAQGATALQAVKLKNLKKEP